MLKAATRPRNEIAIKTSTSVMPEGEIINRVIETRKRITTHRRLVFRAHSVVRNIRLLIFYDLIGIIGIVRIVIIAAILTITAIIVATTSTTVIHQRKSVSRQTRVSAPQTPTIGEIAVPRAKPRTNLSAVITVARTIQKRFRRCKSRTTRSWTILWARSITRTLCVFWWKSTRLIKSASTRHISAALNSRANELKTNAINRSPRKPVVNWMKS